ncbi:MAG: hypothetical protein H7Y38_13250 [Armatimonadetes bacterium]|nr:hypothetical protein [Armatimonadota bacterium]
MTRTLLIALTVTVLATATGVANADVIYGSTTDSLYTINTTTNAQTLIAATGLTNINGLAYDSASNSLFYRNGSSGTNQGNGALYRYNLSAPPATAQSLVVAATFFTNNPGQSIGAATNASFYNGNYWFVGQGSDVLVRFNPFTQVVATFANFDNTASTFAFNGDIAIDRNGVLYGSSADRFWSVNIASGLPTGYASIVNVGSNQTNSVNRQLAFGANGTTLFGYKDVGGTRQWANIAPNGVTSDVPAPLSNVRPYLDLASAAVIPEPGTATLSLLGVVGVGLGILRRRK